MAKQPKKTSAKTGAKTGVSAGASVSKAAPQAAPKAALPKHRRQDIKKCSACGKDHTRVLFILRPESLRGDYPYQATCPISGKTILLKLGG